MALRYTTAQSPADRDAVYRFRWARSRRNPEDGADGCAQADADGCRRVDRFDAFPDVRILTVSQDNQLVGTLRTRPGDEGTPWARGARILHVDALWLSEQPGEDQLMGLLRAALHVALNEGHPERPTALTIESNPWLQGVLAPIGFTPVLGQTSEIMVAAVTSLLSRLGPGDPDTVAWYAPYYDHRLFLAGESLFDEDIEPHVTFLVIKGTVDLAQSLLSDSTTLGVGDFTHPLRPGRNAPRPLRASAGPMGAEVFRIPIRQPGGQGGLSSTFLEEAHHLLIPESPR